MVTYPLSMLVWEAILLFLLKLGSRRQIKWLLRQNAAVVLSHLAALTKEDLSYLTSVACDDTIKDLLAQVNVDQLQKVVQEMVRHLLKQRKLEHARLLGEYNMIALDATGLFHRHAPHCPHCLISKTGSTGELLYSHNVLEGKLITESGLAFSIATELIENKGEDNFDFKQRKRKAGLRTKGF